MVKEYANGSNIISMTSHRLWAQRHQLAFRQHIFARAEQRPEPPRRSARPLELPRPRTSALIGTFEKLLEPAGHLTLPESLRDGLPGECVLSRGLDGCLCLLPPEDWHALLQRMCQNAAEPTAAHRMRRHLCACAGWAAPDEQGRITLPERLRSYAGMTERVVLVGMYSYVELWSRDRWEQAVTSL
jgi:MraZ protein